MSVLSLKRTFLFFITALFLLTTVPASAHDLDMGGSKWCIGRDRILFTVELGLSLFPRIKGIKESGQNPDALSEEQLQQMAARIIQPYINERLSVSINDKAHPVKVNRIVREDGLWKIWLSIDDISFNKPENPVKIDYRLLFEETSNGHVNISYLYFSDAAPDAVQKVFDYAHPDAQKTFEYNSQVWELSIKGTAAPGANAASDKKSNIPVVNERIKKPDAARNATDTPAGTQSREILPQSANSPSESKEAGSLSHNPAKRSVWADTGKFLLLGIKHILTGYDHIAFLLALVVIGLTFKEVLKIVTAFTVAHSITLLLAALQIVSLNARFVEIVIALSICYVALENLFRKEVNYRWLVTFAFGLIHGFGFASVLQELITVRSNLVPLVLSFNMGVEIGQLMIFLAVLPVLHLLRNRFEFRKVTAATSVAIFIMGFAWLVERAFDLKLLSF